MPMHLANHISASVMEILEFFCGLPGAIAATIDILTRIFNRRNANSKCSGLDSSSECGIADRQAADLDVENIPLQSLDVSDDNLREQALGDLFISLGRMMKVRGRDT
jgi:hypothetical protein